MESSPIQRTVLNKDTYPKVIDITFRELIPPIDNTSQFRTVDYFFELYEDIFYEIPPLGDSLSHEYIIKKSTDFVGIETRSSEIDALIAEINDLRRQLLEANQQIIEISTK